MVKALRTNIRKLFLIVALIAIAGIGNFNASASAESFPLINGGKPLGGNGEVATSSGEIAISAQKIWTREEMLSAIPYPAEKVGRAPQAGDPVQSSTGPEVKMAGGLSKIDKTAKKGSDPLPSGDVSAQYSAGILDPSYYSQFPFRTIGKVFFTSNGVNYVCSGSIMGNNAIWTAGHCVYDPSVGWHSNWVFVPAYADGNAPYGQWYARELWALNGWIYNRSFSYDIGAAVLWQNNGTSIGPWLGWLGWMANGPRGLYITAFGYPAAYPFNGQRMAWCQDYTWQDFNFNPATNGMGCNMTGGASGGPWIYLYTYNSAGNNNYVNGVNSYKYNNDPNSIYSPYFGDGAINLYNSVINR
ncbi:MAG TPA: trypsin-like serine protease [Herpetosiphonaceae bacterium]